MLGRMVKTWFSRRRPVGAKKGRVAVHVSGRFLINRRGLVFRGRFLIQRRLVRIARGRWLGITRAAPLSAAQLCPLQEWGLRCGPVRQGKGCGFRVRWSVAGRASGTWGRTGISVSLRQKTGFPIRHLDEHPLSGASAPSKSEQEKIRLFYYCLQGLYHEN